MKEDYLITIHGQVERRDGDHDDIRLMTRGDFVKRGSSYYIVYRESETTGYEGCVTVVRADASQKVSMLRYGEAASQLVIEKGRRHLCLYETGYGSMTLGIAADEIENGLSDTGGRLFFSYLIDLESSSLSRNSVEITVKPTG